MTTSKDTAAHGCGLHDEDRVLTHPPHAKVFQNEEDTRHKVGLKPFEKQSLRSVNVSDTARDSTGFYNFVLF